MSCVCAAQKAKRMLQTIDAELAPLTTQLAAVQNISPPDFLSYATWLANQAAVKQRWDGERHLVLAGHTLLQCFLPTCIYLLCTQHGWQCSSSWMNAAVYHEQRDKATSLAGFQGMQKNQCEQP
jgi:hypothetical protein